MRCWQGIYFHIKWTHLVELTTPKRYDPTEGPHGFLGKITSRLQLHLYIGEAY